jgi:hypothetical protein
LFPGLKFFIVEIDSELIKPAKTKHIILKGNAMERITGCRKKKFFY